MTHPYLSVEANVPLGARTYGAFHIPTPPGVAQQLAHHLPGVRATATGVCATLDQLPILAQYGLPMPDLAQRVAGSSFPGHEWYTREFLPRARPHQPAMVEWLALRSYAINADPMRSGKTPTTIAATQLVGAERVLIACPAIVKLTWAREIAKWTGEPALILDGRAGVESRLFCVACDGKAFVPGADGGLVRCGACRARNGSSYGYLLGGSPEGTQELLRTARWVICNYDLLVPQTEFDPSGKRYVRADLAGWAETLAERPFALAVLDEAHLLRGRTEKARRSLSRRDRLRMVLRRVPRVWALTGTPIYGMTRDLYGLLDTLSPGSFGSGFRFDQHYAGATHNGYGWEAKGQTNVTELRTRLATFMLKRGRAEIAPGMAPKHRQVTRIDALDADLRRPKDDKRTVSGIHGQLRITARIKERHAVAAAFDACAEGERVIIFTYLRESVEKIGELIESRLTGRTERDTRIDREAFQFWLVDGGLSDRARDAVAGKFREHTGPGILVATMDSVPVGISLAGASQVLFADLHVEPATLLQAEDRALVHGVGGLSVTYFVVDKTVDEHVVAIVLPKMEQIEVALGDTEAGAFRAAFTPEVVADEVWARMVQAADGITG